MSLMLIDSMDSSPSPAQIRLVIAEDHELARCGLVLTLDERNRFKIVGEAEDGQRAIDVTLLHKPDVVLMDLAMPRLDGVTATRILKARLPETKVIMLTSRQDTEAVYAALASGADAYCLKDIKMERLCQVIDLVMEGGLWLDPAIAQVVMGSLGTSSSAAGEPATPGNEDTGGGPRKKYNAELTDREHEVLQLIVAGKSNKEIATLLKITVHTVKAHVCNVIQKLAVDDRTQAAVKALQDGLVQQQAPDFNEGGPPATRGFLLRGPLPPQN